MVATQGHFYIAAVVDVIARRGKRCFCVGHRIGQCETTQYGVTSGYVICPRVVQPGGPESLQLFQALRFHSLSEPTFCEERRHRWINAAIDSPGRSFQAVDSDIVSTPPPSHDSPEL